MSSLPALQYAGGNGLTRAGSPVDQHGVDRDNISIRRRGDSCGLPSFRPDSPKPSPGRPYRSGSPFRLSVSSHSRSYHPRSLTSFCVCRCPSKCTHSRKAGPSQGRLSSLMLLCGVEVWVKHKTPDGSLILQRASLPRFFRSPEQ